MCRANQSLICIQVTWSVNVIAYTFLIPVLSVYCLYRYLAVGQQLIYTRYKSVCSFHNSARKRFSKFTQFFSLTGPWSSPTPRTITHFTPFGRSFSVFSHIGRALTSCSPYTMSRSSPSPPVAGSWGGALEGETATQPASKVDL